MKAIHAGKKKGDKLDSEKIARLIGGGTFPLSLSIHARSGPPATCPQRRMFLVRRRSELLAYAQLANQQYNHDHV